jgi:hypothetical protein
MKSFLLALPAVWIALCFPGCSSLEVRTDWDQHTDFSQLKTYTWSSAAQPHTGNPELDDDLLNERVRSSVDEILAAKGYRKLSEGIPDFTVGYKITVKEQTDVESMPNMGYGYRYGGWAGGGQIFTIHYQVGTLILDIKDPATKKIIWRGYGIDDVDPAKTPEKRDAQTAHTMELILAKFPPGVSK